MTISVRTQTRFSKLLQYLTWQWIDICQHAVNIWWFREVV